MRISEERISLKDGRELILRSAEEKDANTMLDYIRKTAEETHFLIRYPEEIPNDLTKEEQIIHNILEAEDSVWFTVFDGEKAIANCSIGSHRDYIKLRHRCDFAIAIMQDYCNNGLGTLLMERACEKAKDMGFEQMELGVYADNANGIALYKKMGFEETGKNLNAFKLKDGTYIDEIIMIKFLL